MLGSIYRTSVLWEVCRTVGLKKMLVTPAGLNPQLQLQIEPSSTPLPVQGQGLVELERIGCSLRNERKKLYFSSLNFTGYLMIHFKIYFSLQMD